MKAITFRPLRLVKKTGKIVVASYAQWNRVRTADYAAFALTVDNEYAGLPADEQVYNHEGKPLFWRNFDPDSIPTLRHTRLVSHEEFQAFTAANLGHYVIHWGPSEWHPTGSISYACRDLDCQGTPTFSHLTIDHVAEHARDWADYEPLTVGIVVKWFGWFLYQLENSHLQLGK